MTEPGNVHVNIINKKHVWWHNVFLKGGGLECLFERNFIHLSNSRRVFHLSRLIKISNSDLQIFIIISEIGSQLNWTSSYMGMFKIHVLGCGFDINISNIWLPWFYGEFGGISKYLSLKIPEHPFTGLQYWSSVQLHLCPHNSP